MQGRRRAALAAATSVLTVTTSLLVAATEATSSAKGPGPDLVMAKVGTVPATVRHGASFGLGAVVANKGRATAGSSTLAFYLSRDRVRGTDDILGASVPVKKVPAHKKKTVSGTVKVPWEASGKYWVLACADSTGKVGGKIKEAKESNNCKISKTQVEVDDDLHASLSGQLTFLDEGQTTDAGTGRTRTWHHTATANIAFAIDGDQDDPTFASKGSSYQRAGTVVVHEEDPNCVEHSDRTEAGGGPLVYNGDPFKDDIFGHFGKTDLSEVRVGLFMRAGWTQTDTHTGQGEFPCDPFSKTTTGNGTDVSDIELVATSATGDTIHYRVKSWVAEMNTKSDWDQVTGELTLTLR
jgi:hypothetical protein